MRALVQRVSRAGVNIEGETVVHIGPGLAILLGVKRGDSPEEADFLAAKIAHLRIFPDGEGKMNRSVLEAGGEALVVSQFTLYADTRKGRRPSFEEAAPPEVAEPLVEHFIQRLAQEGLPVSTGRFRAHMLVEIHNDGPVTILLER